MCTNTTATLGTTTTIIHPRSSSSSSLMNGNGGGGVSGVNAVNSGIVEPFPFSTFHFLRTCNRLLIPTTDLIPYYNFTKDPEKIMDCLSNDNKMITSNTNNTSHSNRHHHHHHHHQQHHHQHQHNQKSDLYSSINDIFPISVTATSTSTPTISKTALNKQNNTMNITSEQQLPSILSASTSTLLPHLSALDYHPLQLQPPSSPTNISSNDNTSSMEYPLGPHNRISELNYSNLMNRRQRGEKRPIPDEQKDEKYYERRKRNNEAAKKSRDARKLREDRIAFRAAILEQENAILRAQLIALREEISTMRQIIGTRPAQISVNL